MSIKIEVELSSADKQVTMNRNVHFDPDSKPEEVLLGRLLYNLIDMFFGMIEVKDDESENDNHKV